MTNKSSPRLYMMQLARVASLFLIGTQYSASVRAFGVVPHFSRRFSSFQRRASQKPDEDTIIHLNHAGASPSPSSVLETMINHMKLEQALGGYVAARARKLELEQVYVQAARLIHASSPEEIAFVESATVAWTRLFYAMSEYQDKKIAGEKVILISDAEYAANVVAACQWARTHYGWSVLPIPSGTSSDGRSTGIVDLIAFQAIIDELGTCIAMVCVTHIPTNSGIINPVQEIGQLIANHNEALNRCHILYLVDACQSVGHVRVNVHDIQCHGLCATGRKYLRGPRGTGFLYCRADIVNELIPGHIDHACAPITRVPNEYPASSVENWITYSFQNGAKRFEFWESNVASKLGLREAIRYAMDEVGIEPIESRCQELAKTLVNQLQSMNGIHVHHDTNSSCGIVTFSIEGVDSSRFKELMWTKQPDDERRFEVSVVPATSTPLDSARCHVPDLVRASLSYTNSVNDIDEFCKRLTSLTADMKPR